MKNYQSWWGYLHVNGSIQVKRYWDEKDLQEARESPFVQQVFESFSASDRQDAVKKLENIIKYEKK